MPRRKFASEVPGALCSRGSTEPSRRCNRRWQILRSNQERPSAFFSFRAGLQSSKNRCTWRQGQGRNLPPPVFAFKFKVRSRVPGTRSGYYGGRLKTSELASVKGEREIFQSERNRNAKNLRTHEAITRRWISLVPSFVRFPLMRAVAGRVVAPRTGYSRL